MKFAAILVVYSDAFADTAVERFSHMARRVDKDCHIVVVSNNPALQLRQHAGITLLQGNNVLHEFGAWQVGIDHLREHSQFQSVGAVMFGNDTFCHYRPMGTLEQAAFVRGTRVSLGSRSADACGALSPFPQGGSFTFEGVRLRKWITTYLFTLNRAALHALDWKVQPSLDEVRRWAPCGNDEDSFFAADMDPILKHHFQAWLFGRPSWPAWRRSGPLSDANRSTMRGKAHAVICEQLLTAKLTKVGARLRSVFRQPLVFLAQRLLSSL